MSSQPSKSNTDDRTPSRYVVGIDLGTTNSAMAYVDSHESPWQVRTFAVPQVVAPFEVDTRAGAPFVSLSGNRRRGQVGHVRFTLEGVGWTDDRRTDDGRHLCPRRKLGQAWQGDHFAAKSWLSHSGVDRTADLLPWQGDADVERFLARGGIGRAVAASARGMEPPIPPAPAGRAGCGGDASRLVRRGGTGADAHTAARQAGLERVLLLEEPQAAFHAWVDEHTADWQDHMAPWQKILVCDNSAAGRPTSR